MKTWVTVRELDNGELIVEGDDGTVWARHKRAIPADGSKPENWTHELITDVAGVVRAGLSRQTREEGHEHSKFESKN